MFILVRPRCFSGVDRAKAAFMGMSHSRSDSSPHSSSSYVASSSISLWRSHTCSTFSRWISPRRRMSWRANWLSWTCISLWGGGGGGRGRGSRGEWMNEWRREEVGDYGGGRGFGGEIKDQQEWGSLDYLYFHQILSSYARVLITGVCTMRVAVWGLGRTDIHLSQNYFTDIGKISLWFFGVKQFELNKSEK